MQHRTSAQAQRDDPTVGSAVRLFVAREILLVPDLPENLLAGDAPPKDAGGVEEFGLGGKLEFIARLC